MGIDSKFSRFEALVLQNERSGQFRTDYLGMWAAPYLKNLNSSSIYQHRSEPTRAALK